jgi:glyoxylase I family protein
MERVVGIGGVFFRSRNPEGLGAWYEAHLGVMKTPEDYESKT